MAAPAASGSDAVAQNASTKRRGGLIGSPEPIAALNRVRILEHKLPYAHREPLVDVRTHCPDVVLSEHLCPYLRRTVADMLNRAQAALPPRHRLQVGTCLRTLAMQQHGWDNYHRKMRESHPTWPLSSLRRAVNKYYAPYDQPAPPGHCTGGAVDVALLGIDGKPLDVLGTTKGWEAAYTWSDKIGETAKANRMLMVEAMLNAGFSNCRDEYWHYSWGDSAWAVRTGAAECPYGWVHPPVTVDTQVDGGVGIAEAAHTFRDQEGRPVRAEAVVRLDNSTDSPDAGKLRFRVNWANGLPVTLHIHGVKPGPQSTVLAGDESAGNGHLPIIYIGDGGEIWERIEGVYSDGKTLTIQITPARDRAVISSYLPVPTTPETE